MQRQSETWDHVPRSALHEMRLRAEAAEALLARMAALLRELFALYEAERLDGAGFDRGWSALLERCPALLATYDAGREQD